MKNLASLHPLMAPALLAILILGPACSGDKQDKGILLSMASGQAPIISLIPGPGSVEATKGSHADKIGINWSLVEDAESYIVYRSTSPAGPFEQVATIEPPTGDPAPAPTPTPTPTPTPAPSVSTTFTSDINLNQWGMFGVGVFISAWQTPRIKISLGTSINAVAEFPGGVLGNYYDQQEVIDKINAAVGTTLCTASNANGKFAIKMIYQGEPIILQNQFSNDVDKFLAIYCPLGSFIKNGTTKDQVIIINANGSRIVNKSQYSGNPADYTTVTDGGSGGNGGNGGGTTEPTANYYFTDINVTPGIHYFYQVQAIVGGRNSEISQPDEGFALITGAPGAPTNVAASDGTSDTKVVITWNTVAGASYYKVYRTDSYTSIFTVLTGASHLTAASFEDTAPLPGICRYKVVGFGTSNEEGIHSAIDNGYRAKITAAEYCREVLKTVSRSQQKMPHMNGTGVDDPVNGDISGHARYEAAMSGMKVNVDLDYFGYCDYYLTISEGNIHTAITDLMGKNGTNTGKVVINGIYPGYIKNNITISGGNPSSGTYQVYMGPDPGTDHASQEQTINLSEVK